jgi:hypothetical protein
MKICPFCFVSFMSFMIMIKTCNELKKIGLKLTKMEKFKHKILLIVKEFFERETLSMICTRRILLIRRNVGC